MISQQLREKIEADESVKDLYSNSSSEDLAEFAGLTISGRTREVDSGVTFGQDIAAVSTGHLLNLRFELCDHFLKGSEDRGPYEDGTVESVVLNLVRILEAEIGGRWVR